MPVALSYDKDIATAYAKLTLENNWLIITLCINTRWRYGHNSPDSKLIVFQETPKQSLHSRFTGSRVKPFSFGENITVGIERNIRGNSPARYGPFSASDILIPRRDNEGDLPLCKREEFEEKEEYVERRVVKVGCHGDFEDALSSRT